MFTRPPGRERVMRMPLTMIEINGTLPERRGYVLVSISYAAPFPTRSDVSTSSFRPVSTVHATEG